MYRHIVITGPEGVGKTTQIKILTSRLGRRGLNTVYGYIRSSSYLVRILKRLLVKIGRYEITITHLGDTIIDADHLIVSKLVNLFILLDTLWAVAKLLYYNMLIWFSKNTVILYERFLNDLVTDYYYAAKYYNINKNLLKIIFKILSSLSRRSNPLIILLNAEIDEILRRQKGRGRSDLYIFTIFQEMIGYIIASVFTNRYVTIDTTDKSIGELNDLLYELISGRWER